MSIFFLSVKPFMHFNCHVYICGYICDSHVTVYRFGRHATCTTLRKDLHAAQQSSG